jgi:hypothetical protein
MRRHLAGLTALAGLALAAATLSVSGATFSAQSTNPGNTYTASTNFGTGCTDTSPHTVVADRDAYVREDNDGDDNFGSDASLFVRTDSGKDRRTLVHFALPSKPAGCTVQTATLRLVAASASAGRTLEARRIVPGVAGTWLELPGGGAGVTWLLQPATVANATEAPATQTSAVGARDWTVTTQVTAMYGADANNGFLIKDSVEDATPQRSSEFRSREYGTTATEQANRPKLTVTFE